MKRFLFLLALGLAAADKLDRTYLPPPGSKYAGGQPGDLQAPLEFPKESYSTTAPFTPGQNNEELVSIRDSQIVKGPADTPRQDYSNNLVPVTPTSKSLFNYLQNSYKVPTTTTSYAFTQTTTFPPTVGFDTTPSPIGSGFPITGSLNEQPGFVNQPFGQGTVFNQQTSHFRPGYAQPGIQITQGPGLIPTPTSTIPGVQRPFPSNQIESERPGYTETQNIDQFQQGLPTSTISVPGNSFQPGLATLYNQGNIQHQGVQPQRNLVQEGLIPSTTAAPGYTYPSPYDNVSDIQGTKINGQELSLISPTTSSHQGPTQYIDRYKYIQSTVPGHTTLLPVQQQYEDNLSYTPGTIGQGISSQKGPQSIETQGTATGFVTGQQQTRRKEFSVQPGYHSPERYQLTNIPGNIQQGQNQQLGGIQTYVPNQDNQRPQNQQTFPYLGIPQGTATPLRPFIDQSQGSQFSGQQNIYPFSQGFTPDTFTQQPLDGLQNKFTGQQNSVPSSFAIEKQVINQESEQVQPTGQRNIFPSTQIPQGSAALGQTGSQIGVNQPQINSQSFPIPSTMQPAFYQPGNTENSFNPIRVQNELPNNGQNFSKINDEQKFEDQSSINAGLQNIYGTSTTRPFLSFTSDYQQPSLPSTLSPSVITSYSTASGGSYPSSTPSYPGTISSVFPSSNARLLSERPQAESDRNAVILNYETVLTPEGYAYSFDTSNGFHAGENGTTVDGTKANGSYSYIGDDGKLYSVVYTADENGFRPHGDHLPTPPPIPKAIQRVIDQATKDKQAGIYHDGFYNEAKYGHRNYQGHRHHGHYGKSNDKNVKKPGHKGVRKPVHLTNEHGSTQYNDTGYSSDRDIAEMNENILNQPKRKYPAKRPRPNTIIQIENNNEQEEDLVKDTDDQIQEYPYPKRIQIEQEKLFSQDSSIRRPFSPGGRIKSISSQVSDNFKVKKYDDDELDQAFHEKDKQKAFKSTIMNSQETSQRIKSPGRLGYVDNTKVGKIPEVKRPESSDSQVEGNSHDHKQIINKDSTPKKHLNGLSKTSGAKYYVTDKSTENQENYEEPSLSEEENYTAGAPKTGSKKNKYEQYSKKRPGNDSHKIYDGETTDKGLKFEQNGLPSKDQSSKESGDVETGYQYIPPQNKLDQEKINRFPSRFSDKATKRPPVTKFSLEDMKTTARPFITPNVNRDEEDTYEDVSEENMALNGPEKIHSEINSNFFTSTTPKYEYDATDIGLEYTDEQNESGKDNEGNIISTIGPEKFGPTRNPGYFSQKTTGKPEYDESMSDDEENFPKLHQQGQNKNNRYLPDSTKLPQRGSSSRNYSEETGTSKKPSYVYVSSTSKMPFRKSSRPGSERPSQQGDEQFQYATSYEPADTSSNEEEYTSNTARPNSVSKPINDNGLDSTKVPYTRPTSQPTFDYNDKEAILGSPMIRPEISESAFGGPSARPTSSNMHVYSTTMPILKTNRPDTVDPNESEFTTGSYYEKARPGSETSTLRGQDKLSSGPVMGQPDVSQTLGQSGPQSLPSTTYRPNYTITDISEPSLVTVDAFGRPLQTMTGNSQPLLQSGLPGTTISDYPVSTSQVIPGQKNNYQDSSVTRPGQQNSSADSIKLTEPRFGGLIQETLGTKPAEFGPSSVTTPGYLSPYGSRTNKVIGEDFRGPKQQQKYDPETGYYY